jgi:hypothetical protein
MTYVINMLNRVEKSRVVIAIPIPKRPIPHRLEHLVDRVRVESIKFPFFLASPSLLTLISSGDRSCKDMGWY